MGSVGGRLFAGRVGSAHLMHQLGTVVSCRPCCTLKALLGRCVSPSLKVDLHAFQLTEHCSDPVWLSAAIIMPAGATCFDARDCCGAWIVTFVWVRELPYNLQFFRIPFPCSRRHLISDMQSRALGCSYIFVCLFDGLQASI